MDRRKGRVLSAPHPAALHKPATPPSPWSSSASKPPATRPGSRCTTPQRGLLAHALHSQVAMHADYGGVVPELASRDHIRRLLPLTRQILATRGLGVADIDAVAYTEGPGPRGRAARRRQRGPRARLRARACRRSGCTTSKATCSRRCSPSRRRRSRSSRCSSPAATRQLMRVGGVGDYTLLGETLDDAAGEAFDKSAKLMGLGYPGGPEIARLARAGPRRALQAAAADARERRPQFQLQRPQDRGAHSPRASSRSTTQMRADLAAKCRRRSSKCSSRSRSQRSSRQGSTRLVVAGGVGANRLLRDATARTRSRARVARVYYPDLEFCTDNGAMIAFAGAKRLERAANDDDVLQLRRAAALGPGRARAAAAR